MKKAQKKQEDLHVKNLSEMQKLKEKAEEELGIAIKKVENVAIENKTLLRVFDSMNDLMALKGHEQMSYAAVCEKRSRKDEVNYPCEKCDFVARDESKLSSHMKNSHSTSYPCDKCTHISTSMNALRNHMKEKHERIFPCDKCDFKVSDLGSLQAHKTSRHENFPCDFCDLIADSSDILKIHELKFHNFKHIKCDVCDKKYTSKEALSEHIESAHVNKVFSCGDCDYTTQNNHHLAIHKVKNHSVNMKNTSEHKYFLKEKRENGPCHFWNYSTCTFGEDKCKFLHQEIPACHFQERCRDVDQCRFFHVARKTTRFRGIPRKQRATLPANRWGARNQ